MAEWLWRQTKVAIVMLAIDDVYVSHAINFSELDNSSSPQSQWTFSSLFRRQALTGALSQFKPTSRHAKLNNMSRHQLNLFSIVRQMQ
ncbi:hypothetical protein CEXT_592961 [Caerostris extrusa]|uniref:Uncharacterized protein n=1 Tax=Caerostris extrusa TaxID=172846 RepID=A0AAV4MN52_CAEEX|nr:hypothetical protein CEXT_592961 [Caerostris extrusa]